MLSVFPDNTVLVNFATIGRMDLLASLVGSNGRWCITVAGECDDWSGNLDLPEMLKAHEIFGDPLVPESGREHRAAQRYRDMLRSAGQPPTQNTGEAETLAIIECRGIRAMFVTDDTSVLRVAPPNDPVVVSTWALLRAAGRRELLTADQLWSYSRALNAAGRHTPPTGPFDRGAFDEWLKG